eukprot:7883985-Alexandrium_andersonii.AAC.1
MCTPTSTNFKRSDVSVAVFGLLLRPWQSVQVGETNAHAIESGERLFVALLVFVVVSMPVAVALFLPSAVEDRDWAILRVVVRGAWRHAVAPSEVHVAQGCGEQCPE